MICILVVCALVSGAARECDRAEPPTIATVAAASWAECRENFHELRQAMPAGLRLVRFEYARRNEAPTQEARR